MNPLGQLSGNAGPKARLQAFLEKGRFPHALLLEGVHGSGKRTFARLMAAALFCTGDAPPCGTCPACQKVLADNHPDVVFLGERGKSLSVDLIRSLRLSSQIMPNQADWRVTVLEADGLTPQAQNALLKLLEEPPAHCVFILLCENRQELLPTVLSRLITLAMDSPESINAPVSIASPESIDSPEKNLPPQGLAPTEDGQTAKTAAKAILALVPRGSEYQLLAMVSPWEKNREAFLQLLTCLREEALLALGRIGRGGMALEEGFTPLQLCAIADIIEITEVQAAQNGNLPLLTTALCSRLKSALYPQG